MANTTIKITQLPNIGNNLGANTLLPVVDTTGTAITEKVTVGNVANFILTEAGNLLPVAFVSQVAYNVTNAAQPNITSVGTLNINTLRISGGTNGYFLQTDGTGNLSWSAAPGSGNGSPGGSNTQIQFNDNGLFNGSSQLTWDAGNAQLNTVSIAASDATIYGNVNTVDLNATGNVTTENIFTNNFTTNSFTTSGNIEANYFIGNGSQLTGLVANAIGSGPNNSIQYNENGAFAGSANLLWDDATSTLTSTNITATANVSANKLNITGNASANIFIANYLYGDGSNITNVSATFAESSNVSNVTNSVAVGNVVGIGNIATLSLSGSSSNVLYGNGQWAPLPNAAIPSQLANGNVTLTLESGGDVVFPSSAKVLYGGNNLNFQPGNGGVTQIFSDDGNLTWSFQNYNSFELPDNSNIYAFANLGIVADNYRWKFDSDGNFTLPSNTWAVNYANGTQVPLGGLPLANGNSNIDIATVDGNITLTANGTSTWTFDDSGNLTTPGNLVIGANGAGGSSLYQFDAPLQVIGEGANSVMLMGWTANTSAPEDVAVIGFNTPYPNGASNVVVAVGNNSTIVNYWNFDNTGNLTLPGNGYISNPANSSLDPIIPNVSTMVLTPDANYSYQALVLDPTAPGHIHLRAPSYSSNIDEPNANLFLGGELSGFEVGASYGIAPNVFVRSNNYTWAFNNDSNLAIPGNINFSGDPSAAPSLNDFFSITSQVNFEIATDTANTYQAFTFSTTGNLDVPGSIVANNIGNVAGLNLDGNASNILYGNGVFASAPVTYGNSNVATFLGSFGSNAISTTGNISSGNIFANKANVSGNSTTGIGAINAGVSTTPLPNTIVSFTSNVNYYTQVTLQNKSNGADATADYILTADNGSDTVNYLDLGIINSGYDANTPTNSLGNIVYAADGYLYAQGNTSNANQSGGNLVLGTTVPGKNVKIFAGGVNNSSIIANISNTGIAVNGNVTATNFSGNISITGNVTGTSPNVTLVAGSYSYTFDNSGTLTLPTGPAGDEGGEIAFTQAANSTLAGNTVVLDQYIDRIRFFEGGGNARGVYIDMTQAADGVGTLLNNRVSGLVNAGTFVTMDLIKATVTTSGNRGLSLAATTGSFNINISGTYGGVGGSSGSAGTGTINTTPSTSQFGWNFTSQAEGSTYIITDTTNNRAYRITLQIGASFNNNMISIERLI